MNNCSGKKLRVIHFGAGNLFGGIEVMLVTLAKLGIQFSQFEQEFGFFFDGKVASLIKAMGIQVKILPKTKVRNLFQLSKTQKEIRDFLCERKPDAVIVHGQWVHFFVAKVAKKLGIKLIHWSHDPPTGKYLLDWYVKYQKPDLFVCNSHYTREGCEDFIKAVRADVVYCPVEEINCQNKLREISELRRTWDTKENETVFLHVARWESHKGHKFLVEGGKKLLKSRKDWKVWFVGKSQRDSEEKYRQGVLNLVNKYGLEGNFRFLGWQEDLGTVLGASDVYCQPNINPEPFGISIIEAMYAGLPVIVTPLGGPKETVQNTCGIHVKPNDSSDLASAMLRLFDKEYRNFLGKNGRTRAIEISDPASQFAKTYDLISSSI